MSTSTGESRRFQPFHGTLAKGCSSERRRYPRYLIARPVLVIPVLPNHAPDWENRVEGFSVDVSAGGLQFEIFGQNCPQAKRYVLGLEMENEQMRFATIEVCHRHATTAGPVLGARFLRAEQDLFREENLTPALDPTSFRYATKLPSSALTAWCEVGIMRPILVDWLQVCPECHALPTFRSGCPHCGSSHLAGTPMIHHFACAHVGFIQDFEVQGKFVCPKCRAKNLIGGVDFEYLDGLHHCLDCHQAAAKLVPVAQCLGCGLRFPGDQAHSIEMIGYHVERLDPLALLNDA